MRRIYETPTITIGESHLPATIEVTIYDSDSGNPVTALVSMENWLEICDIADEYSTRFKWADKPTNHGTGGTQ